MNINRITPEEFVAAARHFIQLSKLCLDRWTLHINDNEYLTTYIKKENYISHQDENQKVFLYRAEYVVFFHLSYGVPCFSFNVWDSSGKLLTLEEVRQISLMKISKDDFYSVVTQQEHPVLYRPYFIIHPCHTGYILATFKNRTRNLIVTFLGIISQLIQLNLPLEYGLCKLTLKFPLSPVDDKK